jgi:transcriptional regulator with XRE-family HTH domain
VEPTFQRFCRDFGQRVRALRERRGLTQEDMMERGFSLRHYQPIEAGRSVTLRTVWKLGQAFGVNPRDLLPKDWGG